LYNLGSGYFRIFNVVILYFCKKKFELIALVTYLILYQQGFIFFNQTLGHIKC